MALARCISHWHWLTLPRIGNRKKKDSSADDGPYMYGDWQLGGMGVICVDFLNM